MKPEADDILNVSADQLMGLIPSLSASYQQSATAVQAMLLKFVAREYERGADIRGAENTDIRALFEALAPSVTDTALRAQLDNAAKTRDTSLAISALDTANAVLRRLLIALQVHAEGSGARDAEKRIWALLKAMAARRAVPLS